MGKGLSPWGSGPQWERRGTALSLAQAVRLDRWEDSFGAGMGTAQGLSSRAVPTTGHMSWLCTAPAAPCSAGHRAGMLPRPAHALPHGGGPDTLWIKPPVFSRDRRGEAFLSPAELIPFRWCQYSRLHAPGPGRRRLALLVRKVLSKEWLSGGK